MDTQWILMDTHGYSEILMNSGRLAVGGVATCFRDCDGWEGTSGSSADSGGI